MKRVIAMFLGAAALASGGVAVSQVNKQLAASNLGGQSIEGVVATVNDQVISQSDVRNRMRLMLIRFQGKVDDQLVQEVQRQAIETLIDEKVEVMEFEKLAKDSKIKDPEIDERIGEMARQSKMSFEQFTKVLADAGIPIQALRDQVKADIAWTALIRGRYAKQARVSEPRIDEMLNRIKASLNKPQYALREIFIYAPDEASRVNARQRAQTLINQINQGADFATVAQQFSAAPSASQGGDMGWLSPGDMRPEIETAIEKTAATPPTILPPIDSEGGVYVIKLAGKREPTGANSAIFNLKQVVARGDGAATKLQSVKEKAKSCADVPKAIEGVEGVSAVDMKDVALQQIAPIYRPALENLEAGSSDILDLTDGSKMAFYVCERRTGYPDLPSRDDIRSRLFDSEITMFADRYLRDLRREATITRH
ncbi:MAG TPA: peptidylprolyl isomerase [Hyphomonadaceae bacterium]|nr:peptidylprolyl isomerase [Hyphomonadaceae bacterium]